MAALLSCPPEPHRNVHWEQKTHETGGTTTREGGTGPKSDSVTSKDGDASYSVNGSADSDATSVMTDEGEDQWSKLSILSLDGGGIRGYCSLLILRELMQCIAREEKPSAESSISSPLFDLVEDDMFSNDEVDDTPLYAFDQAALDSKKVPSSRYVPCHYFDYIGGTSTGGLVALMLGRLRFSVDEALREYKHLAGKVLGEQNSRFRRSFTRKWPESRGDALRQEFDYLKPHQPSSDEQANNFRSDASRCRTIVCAVESNHSKSLQTPFLFRSYENSALSPKAGLRNGRFLNRRTVDQAFSIGQVATAATAAPHYFKSIDVGDSRYSDAGIYLNNPSWEILSEVSLAALSAHARVDLLLSVGGGSAKGNYPKQSSRISSLLQTMVDMSSNVDRKMKSATARERFSYYRLDVKEGLHDVKINEWKPRRSGSKTLERIDSAAREYLGRQDVRREIGECAVRLVKKRRKRAQTMLWERFATGVRYKCPFDDCPTPNAKYQHRNALLDHLRAWHKVAPPDAGHFAQVQEWLDQGRDTQQAKKLV